MDTLPEDIGTCRTGPNGEIVELDRGDSGQGYIFKSWDAYNNRPQDPCYVPELFDYVYTAEEFLEICGSQKECADILFEECCWQKPETLLDEWLLEKEWVECGGCGKLVFYGMGSYKKSCPYCGKAI